MHVANRSRRARRPVVRFVCHAKTHFRTRSKERPKRLYCSAFCEDWSTAQERVTFADLLFRQLLQFIFAEFLHNLARYRLAEVDVDPAEPGKPVLAGPGVEGAFDGRGYYRYTTSHGQCHEPRLEGLYFPVESPTPLGKNGHYFVMFEPFERFPDTRQPAALKVDRKRINRSNEPCERSKLEEIRPGQEVHPPPGTAADQRGVKVALVIGHQQSGAPGWDVLRAAGFDAIYDHSRKTDTNPDELIPDSMEQRSLGHGFLLAGLGWCLPATTHERLEVIHYVIPAHAIR